MFLPNQLSEIVESRLKGLKWLEGKSPASLYEPIRYILGLGGKRMRPLFCLMACNLFSDEVEQAVPAALALEVFHNFTLLHDDVMDKAPLRRNNPTVHKKWNENVAILSGDAMAIVSYQLLSECPEHLLKPFLEIFNQTALQVCEGQQLDMEFETRSNVTIEDYIEMINLKTAVLPAACLQMGALAGGATESDALLLYEFGRQIGLGFQLQDDLLDVYGQEDRFGKTIGGDIVAGKKTFLLLSALEHAHGEIKNQLETSLLISDSLEKISRITSVYDQLGIHRKTIKQQEKYYSEAFDLLSCLSVSDERKEGLKNLVSGLIGRNH